MRWFSAGCSNSSNKSSGGLTSSAAASGGSSSSGCNGTGPAYKIGFQGPLSGDNKHLGIDEVNGVNLAVDQANAAKNLCFKLSVLQGDDQCSTGPAPAAAAALIQDTAVVGARRPGLLGRDHGDRARATPQAGIALISPSATNATLTSQGFTTFHRIVPTDGIEGKATADYLATKYKTVFVVDDTSTYGQGVANVVRDELKAKGVKVDTQSIARRPRTTARSPPRSRPPVTTAMYYGGYDAQAGLLAKALQRGRLQGLRDLR